MMREVRRIRGCHGEVRQGNASTDTIVSFGLGNEVSTAGARGGLSLKLQPLVPPLSMILPLNSPRCVSCVLLREASKAREHEVAMRASLLTPPSGEGERTSIVSTMAGLTSVEDQPRVKP
ncbi:hypothetical protein E2C01_043789 [Portunus trituberculatus]|uniref:Uncharacterized protein n=1 Tax=Portunus trituberculatus TaxID=210409 RepID=A0A5B7FTV5_PORTR|nr:hypothetical protein [Portunus trituberculatus]